MHVIYIFLIQMSQIALSEFELGPLICRWNERRGLKQTQCFKETTSLTVPRPKDSVQILCIGTDRSQQTVQTKIRLLLKKQSDQGLRCLPFHQHLLDALMQ